VRKLNSYFIFDQHQAVWTVFDKKMGS